MCDVLHAVDQGVACHVVANVFIEIMGLRHWGGNQELQLKGLQVDVPHYLTFCVSLSD